MTQAPLSFSTFIMSCEPRRSALSATLASLKSCGWPDTPEIVLDDQSGPTSIARVNATWRRMIKRASGARSDFVLLCEDDVVFGRWFPDNLRSWPPLRQLPKNGSFYGSLYNPGRPFLSRRDDERYFIADPHFVWGAQALVLTPITARHIDVTWEKYSLPGHGSLGNADCRMPVAAASLAPIYFHVPSLVDHAPEPTTWGGMAHRSIDFDENWRAPGLPIP